LNSKFHFLSTTIRTFYDPRSTHLFIGVQYFSVVSVLQSHVFFTENSVIVITDHHNSSDLHRTDRATLQRAPFNSMSYICVNTVKIESCVCAATARSLVDYNSCAVGTSQNKNASHAGLQAIRASYRRITVSQLRLGRFFLYIIVQHLIDRFCALYFLSTFYLLYSVGQWVCQCSHASVVRTT
jgi:hypothetical protein